ncbi:putative metallopeptidase [Aquirhabdus parva]|uniref:Putative phage metallopeptidase domain-containing protein n=1 Tax=Aquirhabdus parva TaxID=2283318 RepID=A0A345PAQ6_9GAMM|nr:putative metallopeptidase [Aquirhabdus parva]AXI04365.1 hypothetical protein HYN46_16900 [Aquirhabdus parva]AXI04409.1 hypothetical protein HYN46_17145 [Aquirhabdus parva]
MSARPFPPTHLKPDEGVYVEGSQFAPAPDVWDWIHNNIIDPSGSIHNPDHEHLMGQTEIAVMWSSEPFIKQGRRVLGQCESVAFRAGGWQKLRQERQMLDWFGYVPKFLITLAASYCFECSDSDFCALVEHELYHIAQAVNEFDMPKFNKQTGQAILTMRGHDVEEFKGVVRRYGASEDVQMLVDVANNPPEVSRADIAHSCGTCLLRLA